MKKAIVMSAPGTLTAGGHATRLGKNTARSPGSHMVAQVLRNEDYDTINIEYINDWLTSPEHISGLNSIINNHFADGTDCVIALSLTIGHHAILQNPHMFSMLSALKKSKGIRLCAGGVYRQMVINRARAKDNATDLADIIDAYFIGRSLTMFPTWLNKQDMSEHFHAQDGDSIWYKLTDLGVPEMPISMPLVDSDCYTPRDVLSIELGIGCIFNCSFCNTPFKKTDTKFQTVDSLVEVLDTAHSKYGVTHFNIVDETSNEHDNKYETLLTAVRQLDYQPVFNGYARLDMLHRKPHQLDQIAEIGFKGLFFGIETLDDKAGKLVRKGGGRKNLLTSLVSLKANIPDLYRLGSFIIGLTHDSEEKIRSGFDYIIENDLLHNVYLNPVGIAPAEPGDSWASDFSLYPEKFGYTITRVHKDNICEWTNDWTNSHDAGKLTDDIRSNVTSRLGFGAFAEYNNWEYFKDHALGSVTHPDTVKDNDPDRLYQYAMVHVNNYIKAKILRHG
jgi:hypothetical protein